MEKIRGIHDLWDDQRRSYLERTEPFKKILVLFKQYEYKSVPTYDL